MVKERKEPSEMLIFIFTFHMKHRRVLVVAEPSRKRRKTFNLFVWFRLVLYSYLTKKKISKMYERSKNRDERTVRVYILNVETWENKQLRGDLFLFGDDAVMMMEKVLVINWMMR